MAIPNGMAVVFAVHFFTLSLLHCSTDQLFHYPTLGSPASAIAISAAGYS
jgi:hypothetical protein